MVGGADAGRAGQSGEDRRGVAQRPVEGRCFRSEEDKGRHPGDRGEMARARIVGHHQQRQGVERRQLLQGQGAGKIDAAVAAGAGAHRLGFLALAWCTGDEHKNLAVRVQDPVDQLHIPFRHPATLRQQFAGVRVDQDQAVQVRVIGGRPITDALACRCPFLRGTGAQGQSDLLVADLHPGSRQSVLAGEQGVDQAEKVFGDVLVRVVEDPVGEQPATVEAFAVKVVEAHPVDRAAGPGQEGGEAGKQFQVDDRVDPLPPCPGEEAQRIGEQGQQGVFTQGEDIVRRDVGEDVQAGSVLAKDGKRQFAAQPVAEFSHRRFGEDGRAHFGEFDTEHPSWCSRARSAEEVAQGEHEGQQPGQGGACPAVDAAHGVDVHGVFPVERGGERGVRLRAGAAAPDRQGARAARQ